MNNNNFIIENGVLVKYQGTDEDIIVPEGVHSIGSSAFYYCENLQSITLPDGLQSIGKSAFCICKNLQSISMPDGLQSIEEGTFKHCENLQSITLPDGLQSIGEEAFDFCSNLQSITLPDGLQSIGKSAFDFCSNLQSITLPDSLQSIGESAFWGCKNLQSISMPDGLQSIEKEAFKECESIKNIILPYGLQSIEEGTFMHCENLQSITLPDGLQSIGEEAFCGCKNLQSITLPDSLQSIGRSAFYYCPSLKSISIPKSVETIGDGFIDRCRNIQKVEILCDAQLRVKTFEEIPLNLKINPYSLIPQMADGLLKKFLLEENLWNNLSQEQQIELVLTRQGKSLESVYPQVIKNPDLIAEQIINRLTEKSPSKLCTATASFIIEVCDKLSPSVLQSLYKKLSSLKSAKSAIKELEKSPLFAFLQQEDQGTILPVEQLVKDSLQIQNISSLKDLKSKIKEMYSDIKLPEIKDKDGNTVNQFVLQHLLTIHEKSYIDRFNTVYVEPNYEFPGLHPNAAEIVSMLDSSSLQNALEILAEDNLGLSGHSKKMYLAYPICRYACEDLMRKLTAKAPKWRSTVSGNNAPPLLTFRLACMYSETRSAMMLSDRFHDLEKYAQIRGTDEDTIRDLYLSDVGLDPDGTKTYDLGSQTVTAIMQQDFSFIIKTEAGKIVKSVPKKGADPEKYSSAVADFSEMKKSTKKIIKNRCALLLRDFLSKRSRQADAWEQSYISNPILRSVAQKIIWQQDENTFILSGSSAITVDGLDYEISQSPIILAHPMEMNEQEITAWQKYFTFHNIKQPFAQIWEPVINSKDIKPDRYEGSTIPFYRFKGQEKHGITVVDEEFHDIIDITLMGCKADIYRIDPTGHEINMDDLFEISSFEFEKYNRQANHIVAYLDKITIFDRIKKDDVSIVNQLSNFTMAQISEFIKIASENNSVNVMASLLEYMNNHFADYDPMEEFTLGDL